MKIYKSFFEPDSIQNILFITEEASALTCAINVTVSLLKVSCVLKCRVESRIISVSDGNFATKVNECHFLNGALFRLDYEEKKIALYFYKIMLNLFK